MAITAAPVQEPATVKTAAPCAQARDQAVEVRGRVTVAGTDPRSTPKITITTFDGTDLLATMTEADGSYCVPLSRPTEGTFVSVFATAAETVPQVKNVRVPPRGDAKFAQASAAPMVLERARNRDQGYVIGVAYIKVTGGRPVWHEGILSYDTRLDITVRGRQTNKVRTDESGAFVIPLAPGAYEVLTGRNVLEKVEVTRGATTIRPVFSGERIVS